MTLAFRLNGKSVLIVDDQYYTVGDYQLRLHDAGVSCVHQDTLDDALREITSHSGKYGLVLLDLNMPLPRAEVLKPYMKRLGLTASSFNQGRALGAYLWKNRSRLQLPYCYLSALSHSFGEAQSELNGNVEHFLLDKATILPSKLPQQLEAVLDAWQELPETRQGGAT